MRRPALASRSAQFDDAFATAIKQLDSIGIFTAFSTSIGTGTRDGAAGAAYTNPGIGTSTSICSSICSSTSICCSTCLGPGNGGIRACLRITAAFAAAFTTPFTAAVATAKPLGPISAAAWKPLHAQRGWGVQGGRAQGQAEGRRRGEPRDSIHSGE